jgi:hypothetical protein
MFDRRQGPIVEMGAPGNGQAVTARKADRFRILSHTLV